MISFDTYVRQKTEKKGLLFSKEIVLVWNTSLYKNMKLIEVNQPYVASLWSWCFEW